MLWNNKYVIKVLYVMRASVYRLAGRHCFTWYAINFWCFFFPNFSSSSSFLLACLKNGVRSQRKPSKHWKWARILHWMNKKKKHYSFVTVRISSVGKRIHRHRHRRCCCCFFLLLLRSRSLPVLIEESNCQWIFLGKNSQRSKCKAISQRYGEMFLCTVNERPNNKRTYGRRNKWVSEWISITV